MLQATQSALDADGDLLEDGERATIDAQVEALRAVRTREDAAAIESTTKALSDGTQAFAAMRMNRGIRRALSGKNISTV